MIQDIFPKKLNISYAAKTPENGDFLLSFKDGKLLIKHDKNDGSLTFPQYTKTNKDDCRTAAYLFSIDNENYFLAGDLSSTYPDWEILSLREIRSLNSVSADKVFAAFTGFHLAKWYGDNRYCGSCGKKTEPDDVERALYCPACGRKIYPRINPAVIVGVTNGDKMILTRYRRGYANNALIAGFTEIGETLEDTVRREVMEEVGLKVKNIRYYKSQPWGMAEDLLAGFFCELDGDDTISMDENELKYAEWVEREKIELQPSDYSLTNEMMKMFKKGII